MPTNQPLEYEQLSYNSPDGSQWGQNSQEKIGFFGTTPVVQRGGGMQQIITVSSVAGNIVTFNTLSQAPINGVTINGRVTAGRVSSQVFNFSFAPNTLSTADILIVNKQVPIKQCGIANVRVSAATVTSASIAMPIMMSLVCGGDSGNISTGTFAGDQYLFAALKGGFVQSVTLTPASCPPQTTNEQQFTVTGLAVGMSVPIVKASDQDNLGIVNARVVSNNVLGVTFLNSGNTALTPVSETYQYAGLLGVAALSPLLIAAINVSSGALGGPQRVSTDGVTPVVVSVTGLRASDIFLGGGTKEHAQTVAGLNSNVDQYMLQLISARVSGAGSVGLNFVNLTSGNIPVALSSADTWIMQMLRANNDAPMTQYQVAMTPTAVPAFATVDQSITIAGLTVSTVVHVTKPSFTSGIGIVGYRISDAGIVAVTFINATAATITPPTETYIVSQFQPVLGSGHWIAQMASPLSVQGVALTNEMRNVLAGTGLMAGS